MDHIHSFPDLSQNTKAAKTASFSANGAPLAGNIGQLFSHLLSLSQDDMSKVADDKKQRPENKQVSSLAQRDAVDEPSVNIAHSNSFKKLVKAWRKLIHALYQKTAGHSAQLTKKDQSLQTSRPAPQNASIQGEGVANTPSVKTVSLTKDAFAGPISPPQQAGDDTTVTSDAIDSLNEQSDPLSLVGTFSSGDSDVDPSAQEAKTIADILAELQALAQSISQYLSQTVALDTTQKSALSAIDDYLAKVDSRENGLLNVLDVSSLGNVKGDLLLNSAKDPVLQSQNATQKDELGTNSPNALSDILQIALQISKQLETVADQTDIKTATGQGITSEQSADSNSNAAEAINIQKILDGLKSLTALSASQQGNVLQKTAEPNLVSTKSDQGKVQLHDAAINLPLTNTVGLIPQPQDNSRGAVAESRSRHVEAGVTSNALALSVNSIEQDNTGNNSKFSFDKNQQGGSAAQLPLVVADNQNQTKVIGAAPPASPYNFASQLSFTKTSSTGATGLPPAVEQVIFQLNRNVKSGNDQLNLQLNPTELGRVNIKLNINADGKVQGTVVANNPATLDLLLKDVRSLERALQDAGLRADSGSLHFSLGGQSGQSGHSAGNPSSNKNASSADPALDTDPVPLDVHETYYLTPGRVNLRV